MTGERKISVCVACLCCSPHISPSSCYSSSSDVCVVLVCAKHATTVLGWCGWLPRFCYAVVKVAVYLPKSKSPPPSLYSGPLDACPSWKETAHLSSTRRL